MKRCHESFTPISLHSDVYEFIYGHLTPETKHACTLVDKKWYGVCSRFARELSFTVTGTKDLETVYVDLLKRYPLVQKLTFRACQNEKQVRRFVNFLNEKHEKHPLSHVKVLDVQELKWEPLEIYFELNGSFLRGLSHPKLESFTWKAKGVSTHLTDCEIQPILKQTVNLKHFQIEGPFVTKGNFNLSFKNQQQLASVILCVGRVSEATLASLNDCKMLESMVLGEKQEPSRTIPLLANKTWNLKHLDVTMPCNTFTMTRNMSNLESLVLRQSEIDRDFEDLGHNCSKLKKLEIGHLFEKDLARLLHGLSNLDSFIFTGPNQLTDGIKEVVKTNCPKLTNSSFEESLKNTLSFYL